MDLLKIIQSNPNLHSDVIFHIFGLPITNTILLTWVVVLLAIVFSLIIKRNISINPTTKSQNVFEAIIDAILSLLDQITGKRKVSEKLLPLIGSIFLFFLVSNLITLIPGITAITFKGKAVFRTPTNDLNTTLSVAVLVVILIQAASIKARGFWGYIGKYIQVKGVIDGFRKGFGDGALAIINFAMGLIDIVGEIAKIISLSLRLFGNIFAGEVLMVVLMSFMAFVAPSILFAQTLLVGGLQAMVFAVLSAVYLSLAMSSEEEVPENS